MLKPSSADSSLAVVPPAVFDLNGRKVKPNPVQTPEINVKDNPKKDETALVETPDKDQPDNLIISELLDQLSAPYEMVDSSFRTKSLNFRHALQNVLDQEKEFIKIVQKYSLDKQPSSSALVKVPESAIGDGTSSNGKILSASESHPVFDFCYEGDDSVPSSTSFCEESCLEGVASRCCLTNICRGEIFVGESVKRRAGFPWLALWTGLSIVMIALLLAVLLLLNFDHLVAIWNGHDWKREFILLPPEPPKQETYLDRISNFFLELWLKLKDMIVLDELEEDL